MATEIEFIVQETQKAKKSAIGYSIGFVVGLLITVGTLFSPSAYFILTWGAMIFCPYYAVKNFRKYKKLKAILPQ